jgi:N-acetylglucosamine-6-phosphate deacetylase
MTKTALIGADILTPSGWLDCAAVIMDGSLISDIVPLTALPDDVRPHVLNSGKLIPGFLDTQVNGGGGVLFNDAPTVETLRTMAAAHRSFGTTAMLPTLISDDLNIVAAAIAAVDQAIGEGVPGIIGIHLEGPFLNAGKKGIHDATKFKTLDAAAIALLSSLKQGKTLVTLAPELAPPGAIRALTERGVIVAAGHSLAHYEDMERAIAEGLTGVTHLYNAMTQMEGRKPGIVGAAFANALYAGLIVDGHHVHPAAMVAAYQALGPERLMLVTDAMSTVGSLSREFMLGDVLIREEFGALRGPDGTLAGAAISIIDAVQNACDMMKLDLTAASIMASRSPAAYLGLSHQRGSLAPGMVADIIHLDHNDNVQSTWINGKL